MLGWSFCRPFSWWFRPFSWSTFLLGCGITWKVTKFVGRPIVVSLVPVVLTSPSSACQVIDAEENVSTIGAALTSQPDDLRVHLREMRTVGRKFSLPPKSADSSLAAAINPSNLENHQRIKNKTIFEKYFGVPIQWRRWKRYFFYFQLFLISIYEDLYKLLSAIILIDLLKIV